MKVLLWILGVLAVLLLLLCRMKVGALTVFSNEEFILDVKVGPLRFRVLPAKEKKPKKKKPEPAEQSGAEPAEKPKKKLPKIALADIREAAAALWPPLKRALSRTRRGILIRPLDLSVTVGAAEDPAAGAELYGKLHCGVWTFMPVLEKLVRIRDPHIHVGIDFDDRETRVEGTAGLSIRVGTLLAVAFGIGFPALRWFLGFRKKKSAEKTQQPPVPSSAGETHTAA